MTGVRPVGMVMKEVFNKIYEVVKEIPRGKVATYGQIACLAGTSPRVAGNVLHRNPDPKNIPCHRVVDKNGRVASNYRFGGWREQKRKLLREGVKFKDGIRVDLKKHLWQGFL